MSEVSQLENQLAGTKALIARRDLALRLSENADFKELILNQFCVQECARYAQVSGDPAVSDRDRADSLAMSQAAGHLRRYLSVCVQMGNVAARDVEELEENIILARQEEGAE